MGNMRAFIESQLKLIKNKMNHKGFLGFLIFTGGIGRDQSHEMGKDSGPYYFISSKIFHLSHLYFIILKSFQ